MIAATCDWGRPGKPEHGVVSVNYASVGPPCVSVVRVSLQLDPPPLPPCECHSHSRVAAARFARTEEGSAGGQQPLRV